jgi:predicted esterase
MLNGEADRLIPIEDVRKTYTLIKNNYENHDNIRFIEYRSHDHIANEEMLKEAANWIKKFL